MPHVWQALSMQRWLASLQHAEAPQAVCMAGQVHAPPEQTVRAPAVQLTPPSPTQPPQLVALVLTSAMQPELQHRGSAPVQVVPPEPAQPPQCVSLVVVLTQPLPAPRPQ